MSFKINIGISRRIFLSMLLLIVISLSAIGVVTLFFFKNQNELYHQRRLERKEKIVSTSIDIFLKDVNISGNLDAIPRNFYEKVKELALVNKINIIIYDLHGQVLMSSMDEHNEDFFKEQLSNDIILSLDKNGKKAVFTDEIKENIDFLSSYSYMYNKSGQKVAIISLPYQDFSVKNLDFRSFYKSLVEVFLILLVGATILGFMLSRYITQSLRVIGDKIKSTEINQKNEPLEWHSNDEIGRLVNHYNEMIIALEESTKKLAKSERELAWREMAKQVAHEIKNPLTPMKLSIQHLQRSLNNDDPDWKEKLDNFGLKMVQQIDTLTNIANEFSQFAKMPQTNKEKVELVQLIQNEVELFTNEVNIEFNTEIEEAHIKADANQLNRVFTNLIKNAIQAKHLNREILVSISLLKENDAYKIVVKDNGVGIEKDKMNKIFQPNFTTKSSGMGLGLAMVRKIVENHHGNIKFDSKEGLGTTFIIEIPEY